MKRTKTNFMTTREILIVLFLLAFSTVNFAQESEPPTYLGNWSNGRGEQLMITDRTVKYGKNRALNYKDITKATDGSFFNLQIINPGKESYFSKYVSLSIDSSANFADMTIKNYNTLKDLMADKNKHGSDTWYFDAVGSNNMRKGNYPTDVMAILDF